MRQKKIEREKEEEKARELEEKLKVRCESTSSNGTSLQPHYRRKGSERNLNARRKRRRLWNSGRSLRYVAIPISSDRTLV